jgi:hypothetical protein
MRSFLAALLALLLLTLASAALPLERELGGKERRPDKAAKDLAKFR